MRNVRIYFSKTGDAKYISHLDLMRCMMRAVARAGVPIGYTEGFNPRPYMNFAMPLSLGIEGLREILDIRVDDSISDSEIKSSLEKVMPPDICILEVKPPVQKASAVAFSKYKIEISQDDMDEKTFNEAVLELVSRPELLVSKIGKQGKNKVVKYINLTEYIKDFKIWIGRDETHVITLVLPSNPTFGINPALLSDKIVEELGINPTFVHITRKALLNEDGAELE